VTLKVAQNLQLGYLVAVKCKIYLCINKILLMAASLIGAAKLKGILTKAFIVAHMVAVLVASGGVNIQIMKLVGEGLMNSLLASEEKSLKGFYCFSPLSGRKFYSFLLPSLEASKPKLNHPRRLYL
jgi:hypothetical protein